MENYNQFTIDYLNAIKTNLKVEVNKAGLGQIIPDFITHEDIINLKNELGEIWKISTSAVDVVRSKKESISQSGLFGLVNDLDLALKVGFLFSDRVVLIDFLFERLLKVKEVRNVNLDMLFLAANYLVPLIPLAEKGRIVIIPNPFEWFPQSKQIIDEVAEKIDIISPDLMNLLNMLAITKECWLHPYTIAESEENYRRIVDSQIDHTESIGKDAGEYAYQGILAGLLSEKLLSEAELKMALNYPITEYFNIISSNKDFYSKYVQRITSGGSIDSQINIDALNKEIEKHNKFDYRKLAKAATFGGSFGGGAIALAALVTTVSAPVVIGGTLLSLSATLTSLVNNREKPDAVISVFKKLTQ